MAATDSEATAFARALINSLIVSSPPLLWGDFILPPPYGRAVFLHSYLTYHSAVWYGSDKETSGGATPLVSWL